ncbi:MaoC family dehydratase N-terminal domain-containing protein [Crossiella sp. SN42]|uniref:MaoC/PaaZ C-terminal domain-containing protein n=1 Tax=Crossiella sp. SN42 TaxID=2944808 RepID=UPI00207CF20E|nr:MaoC/PaaZ C-terminal domain-containing protein [Crossiella sp. SN42]MCO1578768.1 MaoC family dehydratase N-terminal domain-containing protein [Crossiella sp. SN42]
MPIDPDRAIGAELPPAEFSWTESDVLLYHLALGATELRYAYEAGLRVLPTFGVVAPTLRLTAPPTVSYPGVDLNLGQVLHGEQSISLRRPIPVAGTARLVTRIAAVYDKGESAVIVQESTVDIDDDPLFTTRSSIFARGAGGFGGDRGPSSRFTAPVGDPDAVLDTPTLPQQALLYRLCGDRNPLHVDPAFAAEAGFSSPILHGLCTYGMVAKSVVDGALDGDPDRLVSFSARFTGVLYPGEPVRTRLWRSAADWVFVTTAPDRAEAPVLTGSLTALAA